ncbi:hypothetical protein FRC08_017144 [Ceratobasidium sp. 394]|nr:hypothetical protein FRC08_017144 [Ceratobasidium sp. 394]
MRNKCTELARPDQVSLQRLACLQNPRPTSSARPTFPCCASFFFKLPSNHHHHLPANMVKGSDIILILVTILFPPAAVAIMNGCSCDLLINICLVSWLVFRCGLR